MLGRLALGVYRGGNVPVRFDKDSPPQRSRSGWLSAVMAAGLIDEMRGYTGQSLDAAVFRHSSDQVIIHRPSLPSLNFIEGLIKIGTEIIEILASHRETHQFVQNADLFPLCPGD